MKNEIVQRISAVVKEEELARICARLASVGMWQTVYSYLKVISGSGGPAFSRRLGLSWEIYSCHILSWECRHIPLPPPKPLLAEARRDHETRLVW